MRILKSPRRRRRLIKIAVVLAFIPLVYIGVRLSTSGNPENASGPEVPNYVQPKRSPFTADEQRAVHPVLAQFIKDAVAREDPAKAWDLSGPDLKQGLTRKEWDKGQMPVVNYPAAHRGLGSWSYVKYSYANTVGLEVFVFPKPGSGYSAMTAAAEVIKDRDGRWLVNYWMPERFHGPPALSAKQLKAATKTARAFKKKSPSTHKTAAPPPAALNQPRASRIWLLLPVGILSLIILAPLALLIIGLLRTRREARQSLGT
ncbi:MAG: hypothetical protein E6G31_07565 [Actinobacteria bacterium]|nr:MAG: hypothetical protein E6G31_07565 [Actinomycetota bacterium]